MPVELDVDAIAWGLACCQAPGCVEAAELVVDGRELRCIDCAELELERAAAVHLHPPLRSTLPALYDR